MKPLPVSRWIALACLVLDRATNRADYANVVLPSGSRNSRRVSYLRALLAVAAALCVATDSGTAPQTAESVLAGYSPEIVERLHNEKFTLLPKPTGGSFYIGALVLFDQPFEKTYRLLSQAERQHEYLPELKTADMIRRDGAAVINEHEVRIIFIRLNYRIRTESDFDSGRIWWVLDPSYENDLDVLEGAWEFYEVDESQTLGLFKTRVVVGPVIPSFIQNAATRRNVPRIVERMRLWVNSEGTYRP